MLTPLMTLVLAAAAVQVRSSELSVRLDPSAHRVEVTSLLRVAGPGPLTLRLHPEMAIDRVRFDGADLAFERDAGAPEIRLTAPAEGTLEIRAAGALADDVASGERAGEIHNRAVHAHVGDDGVFLSEGSAWHPQPLDETGHPALVPSTCAVAPIEGWVFVATGDPETADDAPIDRPAWRWRTPRAVEGVAIAGNRHAIVAKRFDTEAGPVEVVMHVTEAHRELAGLFIDAAGHYLDLYVPRLGAYPFRRFTIVENFFSSGFAFPGFTLLGPRVVGMAPRSLAPGYLDHELVHAWWGNGVYVDPADGNWCEALTSYCTNYGRRLLDEGERAGFEHRRSVLMKLSADPDALDNGPLGDFGRDPEVNRFVGYDKGSFVFAMLEQMVPGDRAARRDRTWAALRSFAATNLGRRAGWRELEQAFEDAFEQPLDAFFATWVRGHTVPRTTITSAADPNGGLLAQLAPGQSVGFRASRRPDGQAGFEIDPTFDVYRVLPREQVIPTISGTLGSGGLCGLTWEEGAEATSFMSRFGLARPDGWVPPPPAADGSPFISRANFELLAGDGENMVLVGKRAARDFQSIWMAADDPIVVRLGGFSVGGRSYNRKDQAVLHTMRYPGRPGRYITVFLTNDDTGWEHLRVAPFYTRDTTIVWGDGEIIERRVFEPNRVMVPPRPADP